MPQSAWDKLAVTDPKMYVQKLYVDLRSEGMSKTLALKTISRHMRVRKARKTCPLYTK